MFELSNLNQIYYLGCPRKGWTDAVSCFLPHLWALHPHKLEDQLETNPMNLHFKNWFIGCKNMTFCNWAFVICPTCLWKNQFCFTCLQDFRLPLNPAPDNPNELEVQLIRNQKKLSFNQIQSVEVEICMTLLIWPHQFFQAKKHFSRVSKETLNRSPNLTYISTPTEWIWLNDMTFYSIHSF